MRSEFLLQQQHIGHWLEIIRVRYKFTRKVPSNRSSLLTHFRKNGHKGYVYLVGDCSRGDEDVFKLGASSDEEADDKAQLSGMTLRHKPHDILNG